MYFYGLLPERKKNKKLYAKIIELGKEKTEKTYLKQIESFLFNKLNDMKYNIEKNEIIKTINNDNSNGFDNILELKNCDNSSSFRSIKKKFNLNNSYYKNKSRIKKKQY